MLLITVDWVKVKIKKKKLSDFNKWCWNNWTFTCKKRNPDTDIIPVTKINSKLIIHLNVEHKTVKLLGANMGENLDVLEFGGVFLDTTPQARSMKEIIDKLYYIKLNTSAL